MGGIEEELGMKVSVHALAVAAAIGIMLAPSTGWADQFKQASKFYRDTPHAQGCDEKVRAKYPSGSLQKAARAGMVEACRRGAAW
jgi:hypothetical protein